MRVSDIAAAYDAGQVSNLHWRKNPTQTTGSGIWFDTSMSPGTPGPQYFIGTPYNATVLTRSGDGGLNHGPNVSPYRKYLHRFSALTVTATAVPLPMILMDYLMFYPFIEQTDGTVTLTATASPSNPATLTRYTDGIGVQIMAVLTNAQVGGTTFSCSYTNTDDVAGRVTSTVLCNTQTVPGTLINTNATGVTALGPFLPWQAGDKGVKSIDSVTITGSDIGLFALVLVKPLMTHMIYDITAPSEVYPIIDNSTPIQIQDDAFLGCIVLPTGTIASSMLLGDIETFWTDN
jgi:hypothetical protein